LRIPFNKPYIAGNEIEYILESVQNLHISGDGPFSKRVEQFLETRFEAKRVLLTTSCTAALEMAALLCDVGPGDEVILPSFTFVSTANAFKLRGASLKFVDIEPTTLNMDAALVDTACGNATRVIAPVHYAGVGCDMDAICASAKAVGARVVEDAAQAVDAYYKDAPLGTIGDLGAFSFHETKNYICGEGGALLVNDAELLERAEIIRDKGTNRGQFFRGQTDKYTWVDVGSSYTPSDVLAAFLWAQLEQMERIHAARERIFTRYAERLAPLAEAGILQLPNISAHCNPVHHMFYILTKNLDVRTRLISYLRERSILAVFHYVPLHSSPVGQSLGYAPGDLPITESVSERLLRLPFYFELSNDDIDTVADAVLSFYGLDAKAA